jgi:hypothetical protein
VRGENSYERRRRGFALKGTHTFFAPSATCGNWAAGDGCDKVRNNSSTRFDTPSLSKILRRRGLTRYQKGKVDMIEGSTCGSFRRQLLKFATHFAPEVIFGEFSGRTHLRGSHPASRDETMRDEFFAHYNDPMGKLVFSVWISGAGNRVEPRG